VEISGLHNKKRRCGWELCPALRTFPMSRPVTSIFLNTLSSVWLARDLQQSLTWNKLSPPDYRHFAHIYTFYAGIRALVAGWDKCLNVNGDYKEVSFVLSATHVPFMHRSQKIGIRVFTLFLKLPDVIIVTLRNFLLACSKKPLNFTQYYYINSQSYSVC
jgi:hypothetical protein